MTNLSEERIPHLFVIAGPNGSGKTSWIDGNREEIAALGLLAHLNPDAIAREISPGNLRQGAARAGREVIRQSAEFLGHQESFGFETTLAGHHALRVMKQAQELGYEVTLVYVATENPSINIKRIVMRHTAGGHDIPEKDIRRRYQRSLANLEAAIACADHVRLIDNSRHEKPHEFARFDSGKLKIEDPVPQFGKSALASIERFVQRTQEQQKFHE